MDTSKKYPIEELILDDRLQARAALDHAVIEEYAAAYRAKTKMPPVDVFDVAGDLYVIDGWHRIAAARVAGEGFLRAVTVGKGDFDYAVWLALAVNQNHGIRRSNDDKRRAVRLAFASPIGSEQSNRAIAEHVGVSDVFVGNMRALWDAERRPQVQTNDTSEADEVQSVRTSRTGRDGKSYPAPKPRAPKAEVQTPDSCEPEPVAVDYPVDDDVPLPHEPEYDALPNYGENLLKAAEIIKKARLDALSIALPNSYAQDVRSGLKDAESRLRLGVPEVCPKCNGAKCNRCQNRGWCERGQADGMRRTDKVLGR